MATQFEIDCALMSGAAYVSTRPNENKFPVPEGWSDFAHAPSASYPTSAGFEALSFRKDNQIVIAYAGTYPKDIDGDIATDLALAEGSNAQLLSPAQQLVQAAQYYLQVKAANPNADITFTGHSLGGGLASKFFVNCCTLFNKVKTAALFLCCGMLVTACGAGSEKWKEEVQLGDGRVIVVEREAIFEGGGDEWASNRSLSKPKEDRIRFEYPMRSGKTIEWRTRKIDSATYPEIPLVFDMSQNEPSIYTRLSVSATCKIYSKYVYRNGKWIEEELHEPIEIKNTNLLIRRGLETSFVSLAIKNEKNSDSRYKKSLKQIGPEHKVCGDYI